MCFITRRAQVPFPLPLSPLQQLNAVYSEHRRTIDRPCSFKKVIAPLEVDQFTAMHAYVEFLSDKWEMCSAYTHRHTDTDTHTHTHTDADTQGTE